AVFTIVVSVVFVCAWSAEALGGLAAITGAYFAGVMIAQTDVAEASREATRAVGDGLLIPLFFVSVGLQAEFGPVTSTPTLLLVLALVAIATKVVGCGLGARLARIGTMDSLRVGLGMVPRGEVTLVAAATALRAGVIDQGVL